MTAIAAMGGSTNGVIHLIAVAREAGVDFTLRDVQAICRKTPVYCNFAPRGKGTMYDLHRIGGTSALLAHLLKAGLLDGSAMTVTGQNLAENLANAPAVPADQELIAPLGQPFKAYADMQICFGFNGTAICFDNAKAVSDAASEGLIKAGHVVVLRYQGPVAAGMPEVLIASAALAVPELDGKVALLSDTRVSGVSHGAIGVHCSPEAAVGGPIASIRDGDPISFDLIAGTIHVDADLSAPDRRPTPVPLSYQRAYLADFAATVRQAHEGCTSHWVS